MPIKIKRRKFKKCKFCGKTFLKRRFSDQKYCSNSCSNRSRTRLVVVVCQNCGKEMRKQKRFKDAKISCSKSCAAQYRNRQPEFKDVLVRGGQTAMKKLQKQMKLNPQWAVASSERMKLNNPMDDPRTAWKAINTKRINGTLHIWKGKRGGNGQLTTAQILLATALGWEMEVAVGLKKKEIFYPTRYILDIGNRKLKIGIEVDGKGHELEKIILKDLKKEAKLKELGWMVLRFTNEEVMTNLSKVLLEIKKEVKAL